MDPIVIAVIVVLCQYPIAVISLLKMFRCQWDKIPTIVWNCAIVLLPFVGAIAFWIYYFVNRKKIEETRVKREAERLEAAKRRREEEAAKELEEETEKEHTDAQTDE